MNEVKIVRIAKRVAGVAKRYSIQYLVVVVTVLLGFISVRSVSAQKILLETGFEDYVPAHNGSPFQVSTNIVKTGEQALAIFSQKANNFHISGFGLKTDNSIVSAEFWVHIEDGDQSFSVYIHAGERAFNHNAGGPYFGWQEGDVRYHVHRGVPWRDLSDFPVNKWHYVRIVANFEKDLYDFYAGKSRERTWTSRPKRNLPFFDPAVAPRPRWFALIVTEMTARGYMDDLLVYEGEEPMSLAVEPTAKLTTTWGRLKRE